MNSLKCHIGDDELLMTLMNVPTQWMVCNGSDMAKATTLRQALRKAHEISSHGGFSGRIVKQPNDEMVVEAHQISRLWEQMDIAS